MAISAAAATMLFAGNAMADTEEDFQEAGRTLLGNANEGKANEPNPNFKSFSITFNPITAAALKLGANLEYLPVPHHAFVANPFIWPIAFTIGTELGYHYYTGNKGANGFYVGPSAILLAGCAIGGCGAGVIYALDIGGQHIFDNGFTIGGGLRLFHMPGDEKSPVYPWPLFTIGYSM